MKGIWSSVFTGGTFNRSVGVGLSMKEIDSSRRSPYFIWLPTIDAWANKRASNEISFQLEICHSKLAWSIPHIAQCIGILVN